MTPREIKAIRNALKLHQAEMAKTVGCGLSTYARWEQGDPDRTVPMLPVYAATLARLKRKAERVKPT